MNANPPPRLVIVGSVSIDTVETPRARQADILGGSACFACAAASFFTRTGMVGIVGSDFPLPFLAALRRMGIDLDGLQRVEGRTFRWSGVYEQNMDNRRTLSTELNVFAGFQPDLPAVYRTAPFLFLANIAPALQLHVLERIRRPRFVLADTMDLWIATEPRELQRLIRRVDMLTLNESEARHLTGRHNLVAAAREVLRMGPRYVLVKKGEHGSVLFSRRGLHLVPAFPLDDVRDPTGAGDSFAGGFIGHLARAGRVSDSAIRRALLYGSVVASFSVQRFSLDCLRRLTRARIERRARALRAMARPA